MFDQARAFLRDKKRMSRLTEGLGDLLVRAEEAGLFERAAAFAHDYFVALFISHVSVRGTWTYVACLPQPRTPSVQA